MELAVCGLERLLNALDRLDAVERLENPRIEMAYIADSARSPLTWLSAASFFSMIIIWR